MLSTSLLLVHPLRLAGPGDQRLIIDALNASPSWGRDRSSDGTLRFTSPCRTAVITGGPATGRPGAWTVHGYRSPGSAPLWRASFAPGTPAEITAAFMTTLVHGLSSGHRDFLHGGPHHLPRTPASVLADRGWRPDQSPPGFHDQVSPDLTAVYRHRVGHQPPDAEAAGRTPPAWSMLAGNLRNPSWRADFTIGVPFYPLVRATLLVSSPAPVERQRCDIPAHHLPHLTARPPSEAAGAHPAPRSRSAAPATPSAARPVPTAARRR
ncbi:MULTISPECIES: DUF317 domain-containing protein [Streptomycetaceae]|uniref:DUF317 domain-containing protein n=1 Tax=Streptomycetaceae TaxID=2062 RepID=UPI000939DBB1|nr:DUF317 domain-containing protein [Streptomyces sp. CB02056]